MNGHIGWRRPARLGRPGPKGPGNARRSTLLGAVHAVLFCVALGMASTPTAAQVTPADSAAVLLEAAAEFEARGEYDVARALYRMIQRRFPNTPAARTASGRAADILAEPTDAPESQRRSRGDTELKVWSTLYGLWLGVAIPGMMDADGPEAYGAGLLAGGPVGFLAGRSIARRRPFTVGQARAMTWGGTWGTWQGLGWAQALDIGGGEECFDGFCFDTGPSSQAVFASMVAGGLAGLGIGYALSSRDISDGTATTVNLGSIWASWFGVAGGYVAGLEDDGLMAATLIAGNLGLGASVLISRRWRPTRSRARIVSIAGVVGGLGGLGVDLLAQPDNEKVLMAIPLIGSIAGLAIGMATTRDRVEVGPSPGDGAGERGALLDVSSGGSIGLGAPLPGLLRVPYEDRPGTGLALSIPLLKVRF